MRVPVVVLAASVALVLRSCTATAAAPADSCRTNLDCSLNGVCGGDGACACDPGWRGVDCGVLNQLPAARDAGYQPTAADGTPTSAWGGSVVRDPATRHWLLFAAEFVNTCPLDWWSPNSRVVMATSTSGRPEGPYGFTKEVLPTFAHNPVVRAAGGSATADSLGRAWIMYAIGRPCANVVDCPNGRSPSVRPFPIGRSPCPVEGDPAPGNMESGISGYTTTNLTGAWQRVGTGYVLGNGAAGGWDEDTTNPGPYPLQNGSVLMMYRGCPRGCAAGEQLGMAFAEDYADAATYRRSDGGRPLKNENLTAKGGADADVDVDVDPLLLNEDPFIWRNTRGEYHALLHNLGPEGGFGCFFNRTGDGQWHGCEVGRHAYSLDGHHWQFSATVPYNTSVAYTDGGRVVYTRRERPQVVVEDGVVKYLSNGVYMKDTDRSHTLVVAIGA